MIKRGFFLLIFSLLGYPSSSTDLLCDHSLYMLIMCRSGEFVSGDTSGTQWDCNSLCGNVQIYQILLAVINLLWKSWVLSQGESRKECANEAWEQSEPRKAKREIRQKGTSTSNRQHFASDYFYPQSWLGIPGRRRKETLLSHLLF